MHAGFGVRGQELVLQNHSNGPSVFLTAYEKYPALYTLHPTITNLHPTITAFNVSSSRVSALAWCKVWERRDPGSRSIVHGSGFKASGFRA